MNRKLMTMIAAVMLVLSMSVSALGAISGYWEEKDGKAMYVKDEYGTHYTDCWQWIDGDNDGIAECYRFDAGGVLFVDCTTPDGYTVDSMGRWTVDGVIQTKEVEIREKETYAPVQLTFHP